MNTVGKDINQETILRAQHLTLRAKTKQIHGVIDLQLLNVVIVDTNRWTSLDHGLSSATSPSTPSLGATAFEDCSDA